MWCGAPRYVRSAWPDRLVRVNREVGAPSDAPLLSVVVIVYNDAARPQTAVWAGPRPTLEGLEVVIVDDASTDDTPTQSRRLSLGDRRVRVERLEPNRGRFPRARNR